MRFSALVAMVSLLAVVAGWTPRAAAQIHHLDEAPWSAMADTAGRGGVTLGYDLTVGGEHGWRAERLGLMFRFPVGSRALAFLRIHHVRFETDRTPVLERWPHVRSEDPELALEPDWPGERNLEDFGQPELGLLLPLGLPLLGAGDAALQALLPFGKEELYPMVTRALVLRLGWRRQDVKLGPLALSARVGWEVALDASGDVFAAGAYPDGLRYAVGCGSLATASRGLLLSWSARELDNDRSQRRVGLRAWIPLGGDHRLELSVQREVGAPAHRIGDWTAAASFRLGGLPSRGED